MIKHIRNYPVTSTLIPINTAIFTGLLLGMFIQVTMIRMRTYNLLRTHWLSVGVIAVGMFLLTAVLAYSIYTLMAKAQLEELDYFAGSDTGTTELGDLTPRSLIPSLYWTNPRWADVDRGGPYVEEDGFVSIEGNTESVIDTAFTSPVSIIIPAIDMASEVKALEVVNYGESKGWETPKNIVGHIPTTPNPGEPGNGYFFGHLKSPIRGEGSVFRNLVGIPNLLRNGEHVDVSVLNEEGSTFHYRVVRTEVIEASKFAIKTEAGPLISKITLVSCVPAYVYSHRLVVTGELFGITPAFD